MSHITEYTLPLTYYRGRASREAKEPKSPPATLTWGERHWWLAGWNDRDMESAKGTPYADEARLLVVATTNTDLLENRV